nr:MAG TPA: hypothetical protein [Inoviridae sp.]
MFLYTSYISSFHNLNILFINENVLLYRLLFSNIFFYVFIIF